MNNIVFIHHFGGLGGAGKSLINVILLLSKQYKITVILPRNPSQIAMELSKINNVNVILVDFIPSLPVYSGGFSFFDPRLWIHLFKSASKYFSFRRVVKECDADVVVSNSIIISWLSVLRESQSVCFVRETKSATVLNKIHHYFLNKFDCVVFLSRYDMESWGLNTNSIVIPNYSDETGFNLSVVRSDDRLNVLFLGGTSYIKGYYHLVLGLARARNRNYIYLTILGHVNGRIRAIVNKLVGKRINISYEGVVSKVSKYYDETDVVIFPVVRVHQGRPIFEAGFYEKSVIIPNFDNFAEYVTDGYNGMLYKKKSIRSLSETLDYSYVSKGELIRMGCNNKIVAEKNHTRSNVEGKLLEVFGRFNK